MMIKIINMTTIISIMMTKPLIKGTINDHRRHRPRHRHYCNYDNDYEYGDDREYERQEN